MRCPRCELQDFGRYKRPDGIRHKATKKVPSVRTMEGWVSNGVARATDGCTVEPDGVCPHGHSSWLLIANII